MEQVDNKINEKFVKYFNSIKDEDEDGNKINIKLVLIETSNPKGNCQAEIFDSKGRYFYTKYLHQSYEYYWTKALKEKLNIIFEISKYFGGTGVLDDYEDYEDLISIKENNFVQIWLDGGSNWTDSISLAEIKPKHLNWIDKQIDKVETQLAKLKETIYEIYQNYNELDLCAIIPIKNP